MEKQTAEENNANKAEVKKQVELSQIHDFAGKLSFPETLPRLKEYVKWQIDMRRTIQCNEDLERIAKLPDFAPISINLDITTACNYACDHCVDMAILNKKIQYQHDNLMDSIKLMADKGLKSIIVIGGGEPTLYRKFDEAIRFMKSLGLQVAIVSNGAVNTRIADIADCLDENDWVRLSLDSALDETFQAMHKPRKKITLDEICEWIPKIKAINPRFKMGFSYIITWKGAIINDTKIVENRHEIVAAAERARKYQFDYIAFKPFLTRAEDNNAEIVDLKEHQKHFDEVVTEIYSEVEKAKELQTDKFSVYATTNLKVLMNKSSGNYMNQPSHCHMQFFRQVLSPLGMYNCPVYRNQPHGKLGEKDIYSSQENYEQIRQTTAKQIFSFNATEQCKEVTCLYNHANWWIEELIENPDKLDQLSSIGDIPPDYFM